MAARTAIKAIQGRLKKSVKEYLITSISRIKRESDKKLWIRPAFSSFKASVSMSEDSGESKLRAVTIHKPKNYKISVRCNTFPSSLLSVLSVERHK